MNIKKPDKINPLNLPAQKHTSHGRIVSDPADDQCLDSAQLNLLEKSFRQWADSSPRKDVRLSRQRILIVFLLIRYTGAKLNEVLALNPFEDIHPGRRSVLFHSPKADPGKKAVTGSREVQISDILSREIHIALADPVFQQTLENRLDIDPAFVRRKFYERAEACGFQKRLAGPEMIRKARAVELMQANMPLPVVQMILGHGTPNQTSSYVSFSETEIRQVTRTFIERESSRKTSARNAFFGKVQEIQKGDIQARVCLATISGYFVNTVITIDSLERLGLHKGRMITAEVKAPWVILQKSEVEPVCSAENRFQGIVYRIIRGAINTEYVVQIPDGTFLCAIVSETTDHHLTLCEGDPVWAVFSSFAAVLHVD